MINQTEKLCKVFLVCVALYYLGKQAVFSVRESSKTSQNELVPSCAVLKIIKLNETSHQL